MADPGARVGANELDDHLQRWSRLGISVYRLTGERDVDEAAARRAKLWVATTEKFEAICRGSSLAQAVAEVGCLVVDEVHFVGSSDRGPTLEALLSRLRLLAAQTRIVGLSATVANARDLGDWLGAEVIESSWRPTRVSVQILDYEPTGWWAGDEQAKDDLVFPLVEDVVSGEDPGQMVVFCGSKDKAARTAAKIAGSSWPQSDREGLARDCLRKGVGLHYRGLSSLRETEASFRRRETPVLVATSGLAQGVNLPARAVIVRDNVFGIDPISVADATQMLGRVGRQGFEEEGYGFLITPRTEVATWRRNLREGYPVRSRIIETLADHILADILLGRITSTGDLRAWYEGTLAYHQDGGATERLEMALADLLSGGFVVSSGPPEENLSCTELGRLTSRFLVEVAAAKGLIDDLRAAPMPSEPAAAERAVLLAAATSVAGLRDSPVPSRAQGELSALLASSGLGAVPESTPWGSKKTLLAAHMCLTDPPLVAGPHPIGPFPTVELRDLAGELTRYLGWLAAAGRATLLGWPVAIAGDLASRIEFRTARPPRGAGRLLRMIEAAVPAEHRPQRVPVQFRQHQSSGVGCPEDLKARSAGGVHPAFEGVDIEITSVEARGSELRVALKATAGDLSVSCRAHAGGAASAVWDQHWDGAELAVPLPHGASAGAVAVDVMAFGRRDWGYAGGVWSVQVDVEVHERRARELIELLPVSAVAARGLARFMGGGRRRRRDAAAILRDPQPYLQPLAAHLGREGTIPEVVARLEEALGRLLAPAEGLDMRPPANVLLSGTADTCERDVVLAALLQCLGHKTGVAELPSGRLAALVRTDQGWRAVCQPAELASGHLRGIIPKQPGVVATLGRPPTTVRGPVAPTLVFLGQYRRVGSEPRG